MYNFQVETSFANLNPLARNPGSTPASTIYLILFTWASPYRTHMEPGCTAHMGPIYRLLAGKPWLSGVFRINLYVVLNSAKTKPRQHYLVFQSVTSPFILGPRKK